MSLFASRLKELRESHNETQKMLAEAVGMAVSSISMYEQGKRLPSYEAQEAIADHYNVDIDYLVGRSDRTTVVLPALNNSPTRHYLMDRIAKADEAELTKIDRIMRIIDDEEARDT